MMKVALQAFELEEEVNEPYVYMDVKCNNRNQSGECLNCETCNGMGFVTVKIRLQDIVRYDEKNNSIVIMSNLVALP